MNLIKFCGFTVHSKPNSVTLQAFPGKIPETEKKLIFLCERRLTERLTRLTYLVQIRYLGSLCKYLHSLFFQFRLTVKIKGSSHKKKLNISNFSKNDSSDFNKILWVCSTFETHNTTLSIFPGKIHETRKIYFFNSLCDRRRLTQLLNN